MAGESFQQLLEMGQSGKRTSVEGVGLNQDIEEAEAIQRHQRDVQVVRNREKKITAEVNKNIAERQKNRELFGTDDPKKVAAIKATGAFDPDLAQRMQIDPEGTRAQVDRAVELSGRGGVQEVPDGPPPEARQFSVGTGRGGERYFTNLSPAERKQEREASDAITGRKTSARAYGFQPFEPGRTGGGGEGSEGAVTEKRVEDILFEGRLDQARQIAERPERQEKQAKAVTEVFNDVFENSPDIRTARKTMEEMFMSGEAKKRGLSLADIKFIDKTLLKRGKTSMELTKPGIDRLFFKPWVKAGAKPGQAADQAEPASVVNPGGGTTETMKLQQKNMLATNDAAGGIEETLPKEQPTMYKYAKGGAAPNRGGRGKPGMKGAIEDVGAFLQGEGRAGYGESGPVGFAKDVAAFYGPRLPGDILSAVGGLGAGKIAARAAKPLTKLRAIENMFGTF